MQFTIPGPPVPKARARVYTQLRAVKPRAITPTKTLRWESHARMCALAARQREKAWRTDALAYDVVIRVYRSARRGDLDNYVKSALDSCNGIVWADDSRVTHLEASVHEVAKGDERVVVIVEIV